MPGVVNQTGLDVQATTADEFKKGQVVKWSDSADYTVETRDAIADDADGVVLVGKAAAEDKSINIAIMDGGIHVSEASGAITMGAKLSGVITANNVHKVKVAATGERIIGVAVKAVADGKACLWQSRPGQGVSA